MVWILDKIMPKLVRTLVGRSAPETLKGLKVHIVRAESVKQADRLKAAAPAEWARVAGLFYEAVAGLEEAIAQSS